MPHVMSLVDLAGKVWNSNLQILSILTKMQTTAPTIDSRHTWFQEPVRFEDAFGRIIPVPSEYGWSVSDHQKKSRRRSFIFKVIFN
jgi:hypothetical protein